MEEFIDYIIDNDGKKQGSDYKFHDWTYPIKSVEYLNQINLERYIIIIAAERYEFEIRKQNLLYIHVPIFTHPGNIICTIFTTQITNSRNLKCYAIRYIFTLFN